MAIEIVDLPIEKGDFPSFFGMFTRGYMHVLQTIISHSNFRKKEMAAFQGKPLVTIGFGPENVGYIPNEIAIFHRDNDH